MIAREVRFQKSVFGIEAIKKAAYRYIDKFSVDVIDNSDEYLLTLRFSPSKSEIAVDLLVEEFRKEVLDQDLRISIKSETEAYRNLIFAHVFSKTSLIKSE